MNIASVQDLTTSHTHQDSKGGGISIREGGGGASFSDSHGNASGEYAGVNEQAGLYAGGDGFDITVHGNTDLKGAVIASDATADKNSLTTGTLTFSDIANSSSYDAKSNGFSAGGSLGLPDKAVGPSSVPNSGGVTPSLSQHDSGSDSATTKSAISAGTINVTDSTNQTQDVATLSRNTTNTNGTVAKTPDVNNLLNKQADMMNAAQAAAQAVAQRIGDYAQSKYKEAEANHDQDGMDAWRDGGNSRAEMQAAGAALVGGLGGGVGSAAGSAAGAGLASMSAGKLNALSDSIASSSPTGNADIDRTLGNIVANVIATGAGAAVGGGAGATSAANVDLYNRQLHPEEKTLAKQIAEKSGGKYTQAQVEDQMRIMGGLIDGSNESGAPATLIGQTPSDSGAQWISGGKTNDGKPILTQITAQPDQALQSYILANAGSMPGGDVPNSVYDQTGKKGFSMDVTGPFTKFDQSDADYVRDTTAGAASMASTNAGRIGSAAATAAVLPTPYTPIFEGIAFGATVTGWAADFAAQMARPDPGAYVAGGIVDLTLGGVANKYPLAGTFFTEFGSWIKNTTTFNDASKKLNDAAQNKK